MQNIVYTSGGEEVLDKAKELWEKLNQLYATSSPYFEGYYADQTWKKRRGEISRRSRKAGIRVELAYAGSDRRLVGFCIAYVTKENEGELDSIYVEKDFRNTGIGDRLMIAALNWFHYQGTSTVKIAVETGNEEVIQFYQRHGFSPRTIVLENPPLESSLVPANES
ncbi:MAG: GNAT family N-acetyltransferase [Methanomassiliicoccales archaeon]|nr:GNAT family N-acetyltransferase [Methanomassiliicoccales archaeon]NYT16039.1 GNAT family N-acetyltransferase [Methanomassiliicoccales archaeon]